MMRLYVWRDFMPDYTTGMAFAIAESVEEAVEAVKQYRWRDKRFPEGSANFGPSPDHFTIPDVYDLDEAIGFWVPGGG